jgi:hypothetical protein
MLCMGYRIHYDGLLSGYNIHFGAGIRLNLTHTCMLAKQRNRIITTLEPDLENSVSAKPKKDIAPQLREVSTILARVKGASPLQTSALAVARSSIQLSLAEAEGTIASDELEKQARKILKASRCLLEIMGKE